LVFRHVSVLPLIALIFWMIAVEVIAAVVTEGLLPYFNLLVHEPPGVSIRNSSDCFFLS
jgi:hypothetical protein